MSDQKQRTLINFKKTHSLLGKIIKMVEDDRYCIDIMQQNMAAVGLLRSSHQMLMENHLNTCFKKAVSTNNGRRKQEMIQEILGVTKLVNK
jgi:DNA-binding FrmR family transcriptional regulator